MTHKRINGGMEGPRNGGNGRNGGKESKEMTPKVALRRLREGLSKAPAAQKEELLKLIRSAGHEGLVLWQANRESLQDTTGHNPPALVQLLNSVMPTLFGADKPLGFYRDDVRDVIEEWCGQKEFAAWFDDNGEIQLKVGPVRRLVRFLKGTLTV